MPGLDGVIKWPGRIVPPRDAAANILDRVGNALCVVGKKIERQGLVQGKVADVDNFAGLRPQVTREGLPSKENVVDGLSIDRRGQPGA